MSRKCNKIILLSSFFYIVTIYKLAYAEDYFDSDLIENLNEHKEKIDLSAFEKKGGQLPGDYYTSVFINQNLVSRQDIAFIRSDSSDKLFPALTKKEYIQFGIIKHATTEFASLPNDYIIKDISTVIPGAFFKYKFDESKLQISVPQIYSEKTALGDVSPALWDDGITSLFVNYYYSGTTTTKADIQGRQESSYLNLRSGFNYGSWRFRNYNVYNQSSWQSEWKNVSNYAERNIAALRSQLTLGDSYTSSEIFDSFPFRGVKLSSDEAMRPSSQRGFAPKVRGYAQGNAIVTVKQNGVVIRQENAAAGPFVIDDLYPTSTSGDLEITVEEANGAKRIFIQPFSSVPIMVREGNTKYSMVTGRYRDDTGNAKEPFFILGNISYGISNVTTLYSGYIISGRYKSLLGGIGRSLENLGSFSLDLNVAKMMAFETSKTGSSMRAQYSKDMIETMTNFTLASYRYSTENFKDFSEANNLKKNHFPTENKKDKLQVSLTQNFGDRLGAIYLNAYQQRYWKKDIKTRNIEVGYNNYYNSISYTLNYSYTDNQQGNKNNQLLSFSISVPIGGNRYNTNLSSSTVMNKNKLSSTSVGVNGLALEDKSLAYNIQANHTAVTQKTTMLDSSLNYKSSYGEYQLGYAYSDSSRRLSYSINGSIIAHPYGVTFGQSIGEAAALVRAVNAKDIKVNGNTGIYTNNAGYAIVPYISPYERNTVSLDTSMAGDNTDIMSSINTIVPTRGAIVLSEYPTRIGNKILVTLTGKKIPFGAIASIKEERQEITGIVDEQQMVYLSGVAAEGNILVSWGSTQCHARYTLPKSTVAITRFTAACK